MIELPNCISLLCCAKSRRIRVTQEYHQISLRIIRIARCVQKRTDGSKLDTYLLIATPPYRGWQRSEGRLLLHSVLSLEMFGAFSILRFGTSAKSVSRVGLTQFNRTWRTRRCSCVGRIPASSIFCPAPSSLRFQ